MSPRRASLLALALTAGLLHAPCARAEDDIDGTGNPADPPSTFAPPTAALARWYGTQTLLADAGSGAAFAVTYWLATTGPWATAPLTGMFALTGYVAGAPIIHVNHKRPGAALLSLMGRILLPLAAVEVVPALQNDRVSTRNIGPNLLLGALLASVLDAALLASEDVPKTPRTPPRTTVQPTLQLVPGGATAGLAGRF